MRVGVLIGAPGVRRRCAVRSCGGRPEDGTPTAVPARPPGAHRSGRPPVADTRHVSLPTTVPGVLERMREIDAGLEPADGVAVFNRMYLTVTERIAALLDGSGPGAFDDPVVMADLDVRFANLWLTAHDADAAGRTPPTPWRPLFETRRGRRWTVQYALAGMNTHIEHDLALAVVDTCGARGLEPDDLHADYERVNAVLAAVEAPIRRAFLSEVGQAADDHVGPLVHVVSAWSIDKARDLSWVTARTLWALRGAGVLRDRFAEALGDTVGMTSRALLLPAR